jgi:hypothetical protein
VKNYLLPCMYNNLMGMFLETVTDLEHMQLSLNDIFVYLQKCEIPVIVKLFLTCDHSVRLHLLTIINNDIASILMFR